MSTESIGNNWIGICALIVSALTFTIYIATTIRGTMRDVVKDLKDEVDRLERNIKELEGDNTVLRRENDWLRRRIAGPDNGWASRRFPGEPSRDA